LTRVVLGADGRGIEYLAALYRPDRHAFRMEMVRTGRGADRRWRPTAAAPAKTATAKTATPAKPKTARTTTRQKHAADRLAARGRRRA
jgi:GntR family transcriptional regulator